MTNSLAHSPNPKINIPPWQPPRLGPRFGGA